MEGMVSFEVLLPIDPGQAPHNAPQASPSEKETYPNGRETIRTKGLKMKATINKATVMVYWVPVDFCWESNMATSSVVGCALSKATSDTLRDLSESLQQGSSGLHEGGVAVGVADWGTVRLSNYRPNLWQVLAPSGLHLFGTLTNVLRETSSRSCPPKEHLRAGFRPVVHQLLQLLHASG
jgi:hypothetical protein